jgi:prevent-host-death family protein
MIRRLTIVDARKEFADLVNRARYGKETTVVTKHGKDMAAVVPMERLQAPIDPGTKKPPQRVK